MAAIFASASVTLLIMASRGNSVFGIHAFDCFIRVECANSEIRDTLDRYLFPPMPRSESALSSPDVHLCVDQVAGRFRVLIDHKLAASAVTLHDAALAAVKALDDVVIHRHEDVSCRARGCGAHRGQGIDPSGIHTRGEVLAGCRTPPSRRISLFRRVRPHR